ncbi:MAG: prepilin peptidase [Ruminococcus sp.]|nr:prepilin peptidase [Ruminococcus sp.]
MNQLIIIISFFLIYYHISGLATTNILRLTANNTLPILSSKCYCDNCNTKISFFMQLPIISYIICKGKCKNCGTKIPLFPLLLEIVIFSGMSVISAFSNFSYFGTLLSFLFYELIRLITIILKGKRETQFLKQYIISVLAMIPFFLMTMFVAVIYNTL